MTQRQRFRGQILYEPSGRALETARFIFGGVKPIIVCNTAKSCSHMCSYCYCPTVLKMTKEQFHRKVELKNKVLEKVDKDMDRIKIRDDFDPRFLYMSFVGDPFVNGRADIQDMTTLVMERARHEKYTICTLTKGEYLTEKIHYTEIIPDWYGISCISISEEFRRQYEPGSVKFSKRLVCANKMNEKGAKTWASMEPYPTPNIHKQDINAVLIALRDIAQVDKIIFGRWNYDTRTKGQEAELFYVETAEEVVSFCHDNKISVKVKDDILKTVNEDERNRLR